MKVKALLAAILVLLGGCTVLSNDRSPSESDQTFIDIFARYNQERLGISTAELEDAFGALLKFATEEDRQRAERIYRSIDVSRVMDFLSQEVPSTASTYECLRHIECGSYAVATMKSWAMVQFTPICIARARDGKEVRLHYQGISEDGMSAHGEVDFIKEGDTWKIAFQSFGEPEESEPARCKDAKAREEATRPAATPSTASSSVFIPVCQVAANVTRRGSSPRVSGKRVFSPHAHSYPNSRNSM